MNLSSAVNQASLDCCVQIKKMGSSLYYSSLFLPQQQLLQIAPVVNFLWRIDRIPRFTQESAIAEKQLLWWIEEIEKAKVNQAQHPIARALSTSLKTDEQFSDLQGHVRHVLLHQTDCQIDNEESFAEFLVQKRLTLVELIMALSNQELIENKKYLSDMAQLLGLIDLFDGYHQDKLHGLLYFPLQSLIDHQITVEHLTLSTPSIDETVQNKVQAFWDYWLNQLVSMENLLWKNCESGSDNVLLFLMLYCRIRIKAINNSRKKGYNFLHQHPTLSPVSKLWTVWLTRAKWQSNKKAY
ncbi:MAG: hypothetical protein COW84_04595 [Gammaproteobacteria bacterium CG22_combo_CG10-13_8_21_14_all_40_8]|nr:MAG: hypothetical protein COW84_04595 [Gammaproteobacteria bacterium CG22_combo_CG10-13_8_21_14_all_40_8]